MAMLCPKRPSIETYDQGAYERALWEGFCFDIHVMYIKILIVYNIMFMFKVFLYLYLIVMN